MKNKKPIEPQNPDEYKMIEVESLSSIANSNMISVQSLIDKIKNKCPDINLNDLFLKEEYMYNEIVWLLIKRAPNKKECEEFPEKLEKYKKEIEKYNKNRITELKKELKQLEKNK